MTAEELYKKIAKLEAELAEASHTVEAYANIADDAERRVRELEAKVTITDIHTRDAEAWKRVADGMEEQITTLNRLLDRQRNETLVAVRRAEQAERERDGGLSALVKVADAIIDTGVELPAIVQNYGDAIIEGCSHRDRRIADLETAIAAVNAFVNSTEEHPIVFSGDGQGDLWQAQGDALAALDGRPNNDHLDSHSGDKK